MLVGTGGRGARVGFGRAAILAPVGAGPPCPASRDRLPVPVRMPTYFTWRLGRPRAVDKFPCVARSEVWLSLYPEESRGSRGVLGGLERFLVLSCGHCGWDLSVLLCGKKTWPLELGSRLDMVAHLSSFKGSMGVTNPQLKGPHQSMGVLNPKWRATPKHGTP